jgi:hypothetical protein
MADKRVGAFLGVVVFLTAMTRGVQVFGADCGEPVAAPKYNVGDKWASRDERGTESSQEVVGFEGNLAQIRWTDPRWEPDGKGMILVDSEGVIRKAIRPNGDIVTTQGKGRPFELIGQREFDFPLLVGKRWSFNYISLRFNEMASQNFKVFACEEVSTTAGRFSALRIEREIRFQRGSGTQYLWYAPAVKNIVRWQFPGGRGAGGTSLDSELFKYELK